MDNFKKGLLANIEAEITQLGTKITRIRENRDNGAEYRNLIQAYKEIVDIYYKVKDDLQKESNNDSDNKIRNIEGTIYTINRLEYMDKMSEILDIKILTEKDNNTWEARKELTPDNHLLFLEGELFSPNGYFIDGKKITLRCDGKMKACMRIVWLDNDSEKIGNYTVEDFLNFKEKFTVEDYKMVMEDNLDFCRFSQDLHYNNHILYLNGKLLNVFLDYTYAEFNKEIFFTQSGIEKLYGNTVNKDSFIPPLIKGIKLKKGDFLKIVWLENNDSKIEELEKRLEKLEKLEAIKEN